MIWLLSALGMLCGQAEEDSGISGFALEGSIGVIGVPFARTVSRHSPDDPWGGHVEDDSWGSHGYGGFQGGILWRTRRGWETGLRADHGRLDGPLSPTQGMTGGIGIAVRTDPCRAAWIRPALGAGLEYRTSDWKTSDWNERGSNARGSRRGLHLVLEPELRMDPVLLRLAFRWPLVVGGKTSLTLGKGDTVSRLVPSEGAYAGGMQLVARLPLPFRRGGEERRWRWPEPAWEHRIRLGLAMGVPALAWKRTNLREGGKGIVPGGTAWAGWCLPGQDRWGVFVEGSGQAWKDLGAGEGLILATGAGLFYQRPVDERIRVDASLAPGWGWGEQRVEGSWTSDDGQIVPWGMRGRWESFRLRAGAGIGGSVFRFGGRMDVDWIRHREVLAVQGPWADHVMPGDDVIPSAGVEASVVWSY